MTTGGESPDGHAAGETDESEDEQESSGPSAITAGDPYASDPSLAASEAAEQAEQAVADAKAEAAVAERRNPPEA